MSGKVILKVEAHAHLFSVSTACGRRKVEYLRFRVRSRLKLSATLGRCRADLAVVIVLLFVFNSAGENTNEIFVHLPTSNTERIL